MCTDGNDLGKKKGRKFESRGRKKRIDGVVGSKAQTEELILDMHIGYFFHNNGRQSRENKPRFRLMGRWCGGNFRTSHRLDYSFLS